MISGIAGASHITLGAGIVLFFIMLLQAVGEKAIDRKITAV